MAISRLDSCLFNLKEKKLCRLSDIGFEYTEFDDPLDGLDYIRLKKDITGMNKVYEYRIRYSDLDKSNHMNNLHYTDLFMNAFGPEFYEDHDISEYDINYISQGMYGRLLSVYMEQDGDTVYLAAAEDDGKLIAAARFKFS